MNSLNEVFEEILDSEQHFTAKIAELRKVSSQVEEAERILHEARKTSESLYGELILKTQRLVDCKANAQLWRTRYEALEEQEQLLRNEEKKLLEQCDEVSKGINESREQFVSAADEFNHSYDLHGNGVLYREQRLKKTYNLLKEELALLEKESLQMKAKEEQVAALQEELKSKKLDLDHVRDRQIDLRKRIKDLEKQVKKCMAEKKSLSLRNDDPEFQRIQQELELCRNCPEEAACARLRKQLQQLQTENYKKQMKKVNNNRLSLLSKSSTGGGGEGVASMWVEHGRSGEQHRVELNDVGEFEDEMELDENDLVSLEAVENLEYGIELIDEGELNLPDSCCTSSSALDTSGNPCISLTESQQSSLGRNPANIINGRPSISRNKPVHSNFTAGRSSNSLTDRSRILPMHSSMAPPTNDHNMPAGSQSNSYGSEVPKPSYMQHTYAIDSSMTKPRDGAPHHNTSYHLRKRQCQMNYREQRPQHKASAHSKKVRFVD